MRPATPTLLAAVLLGLAACATTTFKPLEVNGDIVYEGRGGARSVHDGMDIWVDGDPPRRYRVLGVINDQRYDEAKPMAQLPSDVVNRARQVGGQALIRFSTRSDVVAHRSVDDLTEGAAHEDMAAASVQPAPIRRHTALFFVIQYVD